MHDQNILNKILHRKFSEKISQTITSSTASFTNSLPFFLQRQKARIQLLLEKQSNTKQQRQRIQQDNLKKRDFIAANIDLQQKKHMRRKSQSLKKRSQSQRKKLEQFQFRRNQQKQHERQRMNNVQTAFAQDRQKMSQYWDQQGKLLKQKHQRQIQAKTSYNSAVSLKNQLFEKNSHQSMKIKQDILKKHSNIRQNILKSINIKKKQLQINNLKMEATIERNNHIIKNKESGLIDKLMKDYTKSQKIVKKNHREFEKQLSIKKSINQHHLMSIKSNSHEQLVNKQKQHQQCKCSSRLEQSSRLLTNSIFYTDRRKSNPQIIAQPNSPLFRRDQYMKKSLLNLNTVQKNKHHLLNQNQQQYERRIKKHQQIRQAIQLRKQIENESNLIVRKVKAKKFFQQ